MTGDHEIEFWVGLAAAMLFVYRRGDQNKKPAARAAETVASGGLGYAVAPNAAQWTGNSEVIAVILVTTLGYITLDAASSLFADRSAVTEIILRILGGRSK